MFQNNKTEPVKAIEEVIKNYFQGYLNAEPQTLLKAFHPEARLFSIDNGTLEKTEMAEWLENLSVRQKKGDVRTADVTIEGIEISGDIAVVKTSLTFPKF